MQDGIQQERRSSEEECLLPANKGGGGGSDWNKSYRVYITVFSLFIVLLSQRLKSNVIANYAGPLECSVPLECMKRSFVYGPLC